MRAGGLHLAGLHVEQAVQLALGVLLDRDVDVEEPAVGVPPPGELAGLEVGVAEGALAQRTARVEELIDVEDSLDPEPLAGRAHARWVVEGEGVGVADRRGGGTGPEHAHPVADVGDRREGRARPTVQPPLVDDDDGGEMGDVVGIGPAVRRQVGLGEGTEGRVDLPLRLGRDRVEDERGLARPRDARHDDERPLGQVEVEAAQVVLTHAAQLDGVEAHVVPPSVSDVHCTTEGSVGPGGFIPGPEEVDVERTGEGGPSQVVPLLWRRGTITGRSGLTVDGVVEAGTSLADEGGLSAVTMRKVADRLGRSPMALYAHVPSRAALVDLMVDAAFGEVTYEAATEDWRRGVSIVAETNRALLGRHPWLLDVDTSRPALGPGTIGKYDAELALIAPTGLPDVEIDQALTVLLDLVRSGVRQAGAHDAAADGEWWAVAGPLLAEVMEEDDFPFASRVGQAAGEAYGAASDPDRALRFGLEALVAGIEARIR